jgi:SAM-dependent methyltransferase
MEATAKLDAERDLANVLSWDVSNWSHALAYWEAGAGLHGAALECLDVGANQGGLSLWLAGLGHSVLCTDLSGIEKKARPLIERYALAGHVSYEDIDATAIPYRERFDIVVFKSLLPAVGINGRLDRRAKAIESMFDALKPGGRLLFAENLAGSPLHRYARKRFVPWGERCPYLELDDVARLLARFQRVEYETTGFLGAFGRSEAQRRALAMFDQSVFAAMIPPAWRYVVYGIARK